MNPKTQTLCAALAAGGMLLSLSACDKKTNDAKSGTDTAAGTAGLTTDKQKFGYSVGADVAEKLSMFKADIDQDAFERGFTETMKGTKPALDAPARQQIIMETIQKAQKRLEAEASQKAKVGEAEGAKFLAENAKKPGIKTTASGLQYQVLTEGTGPKPKASDTVKVNYKGTLVSGEVFDQQVDPSNPIPVPLTSVIPGWTEGLQLMPVGSKYKFFIPGKLAYGEHGMPPKISPNAVLIFEVDLRGIDGGAAGTPAPTAMPTTAAKK